MAQSWPPRLWGAQNELHTRAVSALALLVTVLVSLVVQVSGTVALHMEHIANVRFMILILYVLVPGYRGVPNHCTLWEVIID